MLIPCCCHGDCSDANVLYLKIVFCLLLNDIYGGAENGIVTYMFILHFVNLRLQDTLGSVLRRIATARLI